MKKKFILLAMMLLTLIGGVKFNVLNAQIDLTKQYRLKVNEGGYAGKYLHVNSFYAPNNQPQVGIAAKAENTNQIFTLEDAGNGNYYLKCATNDYYIKCAVGSQWWCVYAYSTTEKTPLYFHYTDGTSFYLRDYDKMMGIGGTGANLTTNNYFKVENNGVYCDASPNYNSGSDYNANTSYVTTWSLEEVVFSVVASADATEIWSDETVNLTAVATDGAGSYTYSWSPATGLDDATSASPVFTPTAAGIYTFTCTATDANGATATSEEISILVKDVKDKPAIQDIEVGDGSTYNQYIPINTYYNYSITQQIYTAEILGFSAGKISKIQFNNTHNQRLYTRNIDIYMINTDKESFSSEYDWVTLTENDKVYSGNHYFGLGFTEIVLTKEFEYDGRNILICVDDNTGTWKSRPTFTTQTTTYNSAITNASDNTNFNPASSISGSSDQYMFQEVNHVIFTWEAISQDPTIEVNYASLDFGTVRAGGDFWTEKETPSFNVNVKAKNTTIKSITGNDDFFNFSDVSGATDQTEFNFTVSYNKAAEAGEKSGNIVVTYMNGEEEATVEIPMTATAYVPAQGDVIENPKAITFTEGAYTDNVTGVYDDYILPNEENDGNNGDAVYTFTLTEESLISANVDGTNGLVAIYKAADLEGNGPSSENSFAGNENNVPEVSMAPTTFFNGFETGDFTGWQNIDGDGDGNVWEIAPGGYASSAYQAVSHSYTSTNLYPENYLITDQKYLITENSKLIVCATSYSGSYLDGYKVMVSETGEVGTFTEVEAITAGTANDLVPYETDLSAYAGKEVYIAINHYTDAMWSLYIDNVELTDGSAKTRSLAQTRSTSPQIENVYPAGEYVLVAAAEGDFTFNITTGDIPAPEATTYVSPENNATEVADATLVFQLGKYTTEYQVLVGTSADALETVVEWTSELATTYTLADATNNTKYYWQVNTRNAKDVVTTGEVWSFVTPLDVPQNVTATATELYQDNNTTTISWTEMEGLTYNVYVDGVKQNEEAVTATEYVLSDLAWSPEGHSVTVTANHGELGESPMSEAVVVKVAGTFTITVNTVEGATVALSYSEGATDEFGNQLEDVYTNVTTDDNGQAVFENVKLLGDWSAHYYEINVTKGLYNEEVYVINNVTIAHDENYEVDVEMTLTTPNFNVSSETIHVGESVTLTWDAIEAENVTYNVYVNGTKHNAEAITAEEYVISDLAYNMNPGNAVAVTAVHSLGETPQDPIYVKVAGTFTLTVNVTDGKNPIEGAIVNIDMAYACDEFKNQVSSVTVEPTGADGKTTVELPILCQEIGFYNNNGTYVYTSYYTVEVSKSPYQDNNLNYINYYEDVTSGYTMDVELLLPTVSNIQVLDEEENNLDGDILEGTNIVLSWDAVEGADSYKVYTLVEDVEIKSETTIDPKYFVEGVEKGYRYAVSALFGDLESEKCYASLTVKGIGYFKGYVTDGTSALQGIQVKVSSEYGDASAVVATDEEGYFIGEIMEGDNYILTISHSDYDEFISTPFPIVYQTYYDFETIELNAKPSASGITEVTATVNGDNVDVNWIVDEAYTKYNVYRRLAGTQGKGDNIAQDVAETSYTDAAWETLDPGTYEYGVAALVEPQAQARGTEVIFEEGFENGQPEGWNVSGDDLNWIQKSANQPNSLGENSIYNKGSWSGASNYLISPQITVKNAKLSFWHFNQQYDNSGQYTSVLKVYYSTNPEGPWIDENKLYESQYTSSWTNSGEIDLSSLPNKVYLAFCHEYNWGNGLYLDDLVITGEVTSEVETQIVWSDGVVKQGPATFIGGDTENPTAWNVDANWSTGSVPADGADVIINADAVISSEVNVASITINNGDSYPYNTLTVADKGILTVTGTISQQSDCLLVLEEGGQIFQNNANVTARFRMSIDNPSDWSDETNKDGWQFISMPMTGVDYYGFASTWNSSTAQSTCDYDLYKYDGSQEMEWQNFRDGGFEEDTFKSGTGYLASRKEVSTVSLSGTLNVETPYAFSGYDQIIYNEEKDLANFRLFGNPFTYDIYMSDFDLDFYNDGENDFVSGYAVIDKYGSYVYRTTEPIKVGEGFFVKALSSTAIAYAPTSKRSENKSNNSLNITATGNAGEDNVIINLAGKSEGFDKLQNFNDAIATVYVAEDGKNYGIYNCDADVQEIELSFNANQMGNYTISIEPNGKFQTVTLVDRFTGIETNMLVEDYHFTAMSGVNNNRFIVKLAVSDQQSAVSDNFVYQSGEDLIIDAEGTVQIIDVMGRVLLSDEVESTNNRINVSGFQNGTYMVRVINGSEVKVEKVVIY